MKYRRHPYIWKNKLIKVEHSFDQLEGQILRGSQWKLHMWIGTQVEWGPKRMWIFSMHWLHSFICAVQKEEKEKRKGCEFFLWGGTRLD